MLRGFREMLRLVSPRRISPKPRSMFGKPRKGAQGSDPQTLLGSARFRARPTVRSSTHANPKSLPPPSPCTHHSLAQSSLPCLSYVCVFYMCRPNRSETGQSGRSPHDPIELVSSLCHAKRRVPPVRLQWIPRLLTHQTPKGTWSATVDGGGLLPQVPL